VQVVRIGDHVARLKAWFGPAVDGKQMDNVMNLQPERILAIGDVHGCAQALTALLDAIQPGADDVVVTIGDYVDRGPDSKGVIEQLIELQDRTHLVPLMGNHELMMLRGLEASSELGYWLQFGGRETVDSYGGKIANIPEEHVEFLDRCYDYYETADHFFVHANYQFDAPLNDQRELVRFWTHLEEIPPPHDSGKIAVVGHTPQATGEVLDCGHVICVDTCCFGGGWLTALDVKSGKTWQADLAGKMRVAD